MRELSLLLLLGTLSVVASTVLGELQRVSEPGHKRLQYAAMHSLKQCVCLHKLPCNGGTLTASHSVPKRGLDCNA